MTLTFLTTTHNHEKYIARCIASVLNQHTIVDHVIVDDGSTDETQTVCEFFAKRHPSIKYYRQERRGIGRLAETYNYGLSKCAGDIVAVLEGDDWANEHRAARHIAAFQDKNVVLSWGMTERYDDNQNYLGMVPGTPWEFINLPHRETAKRLLQGCFLSANTVAVRRSALEQIGGFKQGKYYVDYPTWLALIPLGKFHFTPEVLSGWGVHNDSYSSMLGPTVRKREDALKAYNNWPEEWQRVMTPRELRLFWASQDKFVIRAGLVKNKILEWFK